MAIRIAPDTFGRQFIADGGVLLMVYAFVVDINGTVVSDAEYQVEFAVQGDATVR